MLELCYFVLLFCYFLVLCCFWAFEKNSTSKALLACNGKRERERCGLTVALSFLLGDVRHKPPHAGMC